jgi:hypothetical protein
MPGGGDEGNAENGCQDEQEAKGKGKWKKAREK